MRQITTLLLAFLALSSHAVRESQLMGIFEKEVLPFYQNGESINYEGVDGKMVHYQKIDRNHDTAIVILPGRTEPTMKYAELIYDLKSLNIDFFLWDPRGQGASERLLPDPQKGYVESYKDYISDFHTFYQAELKNYKKVFVVAHSMGAGISIRYAQEYPGKISGHILSAPMIEILTKGYPEIVSLNLMRVLKIAGKGQDYVPGGGRFETPTPFEENGVTHSNARYTMARRVDEEDPIFYMGSATNNWLLEGIKMSKKIMKKSERKKLYQTPMLIFQAGKDTYSKSKRHKVLCDAHPKCQLKRFELAKHEMFQETDSIRDQVIKMTMDFIKEKI